MNSNEVNNKVSNTLQKYHIKFSNKSHININEESDMLMDLFGINKQLKDQNKQYWGRELGKCWEIMVRNIFSSCCNDFNPPIRFGKDEPADFFVGKYAIDTKYRVGSGDSGTLKKFESYGKLLSKNGYEPIFLFLRTDNLKSALSKMNSGGWKILMGNESFEFILNHTNYDLKKFLKNQIIESKYLI